MATALVFDRWHCPRPNRSSNSPINLCCYIRFVDDFSLIGWFIQSDRSARQGWREAHHPGGQLSSRTTRSWDDERGENTRNQYHNLIGNRTVGHWWVNQLIGLINDWVISWTTRSCRETSPGDHRAVLRAQFWRNVRVSIRRYAQTPYRSWERGHDCGTSINRSINQSINN